MLKLRRLLASIAASALVLSAASPSMASAAGLGLSVNALSKLHPALRFGTGPGSTALARVIVQTQKPLDLSHALQLAKLVPGSNLVEQYHLIPALVLQVPVNLLPVLAASPDVRYVSPDGPVQVMPESAVIKKSNGPRPQAPRPVDEHKVDITSANLLTTYPFDLGAPEAWSGSASWDNSRLTGSKVSVAVIDSGIDATHPDLAGHVVAVNVNANTATAADGYGHGTHVAGVIAGHDPSGQYLGIAPNATVISVKVTDDNGSAFESDVLRGLDWVNQNAGAYHIGAVNLSLTTSIPESYAVSPVDAAVEFLVHQNVTVVAAAGNLGNAEDAVWYAPANDPLAITVGCIDDNQTTVPTDDSLCPISSRGVTEDGFAKPDVVAPGRKIVSALAAPLNGVPSTLAQEFSDRVTADGQHIRLSGTSMAAPMITGAVALLLERHPGLQPSQVRQILLNSATAYPGQSDKASRISIPRAIAATQHPPAATNAAPLPISGIAPPAGSHTLLWDGGQWAQTYWDSAHWDSAHWDSAHWDSAYWDSAHWDSSYLDSAHWDSAHWDSAHWDSAHWDSAHWDSAHWDSAHWDSAHWDNGDWD
jgi:serine protease AprX